MGEEAALLVTCEHGGRRVPAEYRRLFARREGVLRSHRAWDPGSLPLARLLSRTFGAPLLVATVTRLVVDANRSPGHRDLFSPYSRSLTYEERARILDRYYFPYRRSVQETAATLASRGRPCLHLSLHTFTPVRRGEVRKADVGLLYDPRRKAERDFCQRMREALMEREPRLRVRRNYPYRGAADGLTTHLRRLFGEGPYLGIELEVNQGLLRHRRRRASLEKSLIGALEALLTAGRRAAADSRTRA